MIGGLIKFSPYFCIISFVKVNGIEFDDPRPSVHKWDYKEVKEGKTTYRELWVDSYIRSKTSVEYDAHLLTISSRGSVLLDNKTVKDENEKKLIKEIFKDIVVI